MSLDPEVEAAVQAFESARDEPDPVRLERLRAAAASRPTGGGFVLASDALPPAYVSALLESRRMVAVRALLEASRADALSSLPLLRESGLPVQPLLSFLSFLDDALLEVEAAERGCGAGTGECVCPCLAGVRPPVPAPE